MPVGTEVATLGITATRATADGFVQVRPCGQDVGTSSLNYVAGRDISNLVTVPVAGDGSVCVTASAPTDLVIDVFGGFGQGELLKTFDVGPFEIFPDFDRGVTDYAAYCTDDDAQLFDVELARRARHDRWPSSGTAPDPRRCRRRRRWRQTTRSS